MERRDWERILSNLAKEGTIRHDELYLQDRCEPVSAELLPPRLRIMWLADNPVRVIEAFVEALDLGKLGFRHADRGAEAGQPPYDPADLLKLYLYGYLNRVRSSRGWSGRPAAIWS